MQALDLYLPASPASDKPLPVIVFIHGGGWIEGSRTSGANVLRSAVASGNYAGVSVGYRFSNEARWPAQGHDVKAAIRWIRGNAKKYNFDPDKIGVWGGSAGAHLASFLGASGGVEEVEGDLGDYLHESSRVTCVVNYYGPQNFLSTREGAISPAAVRGLLGGAPSEVADIARAASPITYLTPDAPPFFTVHGTDDKTVPYGQALDLDDALKKVGVTHSFITWTGGGHRSRSSETRRRVGQFLDLHLRGIPATIDTSAVVPDPQPVISRQ